MSFLANLQKQLYGVAIFEEEIVLTDYTGDGEKSFCVTPAQLMDFFRSEVTFRPFPGLVWMKSDGSGESYLVTLPAAERTILYRKGRKESRKGNGKLQVIKLQLPAVAVLARVGADDRKIFDIDLWAFAGKVLAADTVLYELPLPNLQGSSLCLGSIEKAAPGSDLRGALERMIFDTPFNHHNHIVGTEKLPFHDYARKYKGRCPLRTLNRIGTGRELLRGDV